MSGAVFEATSSLNISFYLAGSFLLAGPSLNVATISFQNYILKLNNLIYIFIAAGVASMLADLVRRRTSN